MRLKHGTLIALVVVAFLFTLLLFLPASLITKWLPPTVQLGNLSGTLWHGGADAVTVAGRSLGAAEWRLHPAQLLRGRLGLDATIVRGSDSLKATLAMSPGGAISVKDLAANWPLEDLPARGIQPGTTGRLQVTAPRLEIEKNFPVDLQGVVELHDLRQASREIGSYRVTFAENARQDDKLAGQLQDLGGPLEIGGTVTLGPGCSYKIDGTVAPRPTASQALLDQLRYLGQPDGQGRRPFGTEGTC